MPQPRLHFVILLAIAACDLSRPEYRGQVEATCPDVVPAGEISLDATCISTRCQVRTEVTGCRIVVRTEICDLGRFELTVAEDGAIAVASASALGACTITEPRPGTWLGFDCEQSNLPCHIDLYAASEPELEVASIQLLDVPFMAPEGSVDQLLSHQDPFRGYATSAIVLGDRVLVATHDGRFELGDCRGREPSRLVTVDLDRLEVLSSTLSDPCLSRLTPDPRGDGFLATFGPRDAPRVGRYARDGTRLADAVVALSPGERVGLPAAILVDEPRNTLAAVYGRESSRIATFDLDSLTPRMNGPIDGYARDAVLLGDAWAVSDIVGGRVELLDPTSFLLIGSYMLIGRTRPSDDAGRLMRVNDLDTLLVTTTGRSGAIWRISGLSRGASPAVRAALSHSRDAVPWAMFVRPGAEPRGWVGLTEPAPDYATSIARFDVADGRFWPGDTPVRRGPVGELHDDGNGGAVALLPWSATLLRVSLRR